MEVEYSPLQRSASRAAAAAQSRFFLFTKLQLSLLAITAFLSGWRPLSDVGQQRVSLLIAVLMLLSLILSLALRVAKFDDHWFTARALAENVKGATWRFIMQFSPHPENARRREGEYVDEIGQIRSRLSGAGTVLAGHPEQGVLVTTWMRKMHGASLEDKLAAYQSQRIGDQIGWYQEKARYNSKRELVWFGIITSLSACAVVVALLHAWFLFSFRPIGGVAALAAATVAWSQAKRFSDLSNSYAVAAEDLRLLQARSELVRSPEELEQLVRDVEAAISREHSIWTSRKRS